MGKAESYVLHFLVPRNTVRANFNSEKFMSILISVMMSLYLSPDLLAIIPSVDPDQPPIQETMAEQSTHQQQLRLHEGKRQQPILV